MNPYAAMLVTLLYELTQRCSQRRARTGNGRKPMGHGARRGEHLGKWSWKRPLEIGLEPLDLGVQGRKSYLLTVPASAGPSARHDDVGLVLADEGESVPEPCQGR